MKRYNCHGNDSNSMDRYEKKKENRKKSFNKSKSTFHHNILISHFNSGMKRSLSLEQN